MEISHSDIGKKVCASQAAAGHSGKYGKYAAATSNKSSNTETSLCGDDGGTTQSYATQEFLKEFVANTLQGNGSKNWPTSTKGTSTTEPKQNDNANAVAKDLTKLTTEEKTIVAGLLAKTIEGGEVVEIRAVSSTFVMALELCVCWLF
ncbi:hypothetical protein ANAPC1_00548 [Anaplasma phagocytophilum]|uniref:Uncharacterized protein n=1 Tax=Anaplasma phagocytophilum TaxID=948 RepID=A0AA45ZHF1_ANAPH|nr:hypothetical protein ANAPC1_00548 [Anaplasma phagocytophilum]